MAFSVDVEDWFCVRNMRDTIPFESWNACELRVHQGLDFILTELRRRKIRATFFMLGWIAERCPELVPEIEAEGHEIASHGYNHQPIDRLTPASFRADVEKSLQILQAQATQPILGYRAPSFSVTRKTLWALDILRDLGFKYDSSIYPIRHPDYGIPDFSEKPIQIAGVWEIPMTRVSQLGVPVPISGGGYFRLYPYALSRRLLRKAQRQSNVVLYFHPWEFDEAQPRVRLPGMKRFRHYVGLRQNREKLQRLLDDFSFCRMRELVLPA